MSKNDGTRLFQPMQLGPIKLSTRIVMGPICSNLSNPQQVLDGSAVEYYSSRGCVPGTLLIGEATFVDRESGGTEEKRAGIWSEEQIAAWTRVVDGVHAAGSFIFVQLWALGRVADPEIKKRDGAGDVVSASDVPQEGGVVPRPMTEEEIQDHIKANVTAAKRAVETCGFDGVELHGGNASLIDQFTQDVSNKRTDQWGGSVKNRSRFGLEIAKAVSEAIGPERVGYRLSPWSTYNSMGMKDAKSQFSDLINGLKDLNIAYLHLVESRVAGRYDVEAGESLDPFIKLWDRPFLLAGGFDLDSAKQALDEEYKDREVAIAFGRAFVSNPDLVQRLIDGTELRSE